MSEQLTPEEQAALTSLKARYSEEPEEHAPWYSYDGFAEWAGNLLWAVGTLLSRYFVFWALLFIVVLTALWVLVPAGK